MLCTLKDLVVGVNNGNASSATPALDNVLASNIKTAAAADEYCHTKRHVSKAIDQHNPGVDTRCAGRSVSCE